MKKLNFALIGAGKMGARWAEVLSKYAYLGIVVDRNMMKAHDLATKVGCPYSSNSIDTALNGFEDIDAVLVVTTHDNLAPITSMALKAGKHVLCEKPGAINSSQIEKNIALAKKKGLVYKIGYNYRFHDGFIKARKLYEKGEIGDILFIRSSHGFGGRIGYGKEWRLDKKRGGGGQLHDQGVHLIDMVKSFIGPVSKVQSIMADTYWNAGTEDNAFVLLQGKSGVGSIHSSLTQWKSLQKFEIYGTKGYVVVEGLGTKYGRGDFGYNMGERVILGKRAEDYVARSKEKIFSCRTDFNRDLALELEEFTSAAIKGTPLKPNAQDAYETLKIVEEVYKTNKI